MANRKDLRQDDNGDIYINPVTGDFDIVDSDNQHISDILQSISGDYKEFPLIGVNFFMFANSSNQQQALERIIRTQVSSDGYQIKKVVAPLIINDLSEIEIYANAPQV